MKKVRKRAPFIVDYPRAFKGMPDKLLELGISKRVYAYHSTVKMTVTLFGTEEDGTD